jgi:tetratricopeptide (TPR) repeat protein
MTNLASAEALLRDGKVEQAVAVLNAILEADPDDADALYMSGTIAWQLKFHEQAIELYEQAIEVRPDFAEAHLMLGNSLGALNRVDEALAQWRRAIVLKPGNSRAHGNIANTLGKRGDHAGAVESAQRAINLEPTLAAAHLILGHARQAMGDAAGAEPALREAVRLQPDDPECLNGLASLLVEAGRTDEARELLRHSLAGDPANGRARRLLADALTKEGEHEAAEQELARLTVALPDWPEGWVSLAASQRMLGRIDQAVAALQRALALDPDYGEAHRALASIRPGVAGESEVAHLDALLANRSLDPRTRADAGFALAKQFDDGDRFDEAFAACATANALIHDLNASAEDRFDPSGIAGAVEALTRRFTAATLRAIGEGGDPTELPVFILGMPRSGTSLVEQILASHSRVHGAGELLEAPAFGKELRWTEAGGMPVATEASLGAVRALAARHLERLRRLGGGAARVTDKLPDNIFHLGGIAAAYPRARVIVVRRDPRDTSLSCFMQRFADHAVMFSYDLAECGHWAVAVDQITEHWQATLPLPWLEVRYEALVADLAGQSRRLVEFLGMDWEPGCLDFHRTERAVTTASAWQVRQPLYSRSVGRWRNYERHLGPLLAVLRTRWPEM